MSTHPCDTFTRSVGTRPRRNVLALGAAGMAGTRGASGKNAGKKARKRAKQKARKQCERQTATCTDQVNALCAGVIDPVTCRTALLPCCTTCDVATGVVCTINAFLPVA